MTAFGRVLAAVSMGLRVAVGAVAGLVLMLSALLFGVVLASVVLLWQRLGGRRAHATRFGWQSARATARSRATRNDVVDVEAREVVIDRRTVR